MFFSFIHFAYGSFKSKSIIVLIIVRFELKIN